MPLPPDPVAFTIPLYLPNIDWAQRAITDWYWSGWPVYWYGILVTVGVLAAAWVADREARLRGYNPDHVWNALLVMMIFGLIGARLYHVISSPAGGGTSLQTYLDDPIAIIRVWNGGLRGLGIFGAIVGGTFGLWLYTRWAKLPFPEWADICTVALPLGQAIGRWGNWFNQELYGNPTTLPWGIPVASGSRLAAFSDMQAFPDSTLFHPTFLYESLWCLFVFFVLRYVSHNWREELRTGDIALMYFILYPMGRYLAELQRPDAWLAWGIPVAQIISVTSMLVASIWLLWRHDFVGWLRHRSSARSSEA